MAQRKIKSIPVGSNCEVTVHYDSEWREYRVRSKIKGKVVGGRDGGSFTSDKQDALDTAAAQERWLHQKKSLDCGTSALHGGRPRMKRKKRR